MCALIAPSARSKSPSNAAQRLTSPFCQMPICARRSLASRRANAASQCADEIVVQRGEACFAPDLVAIETVRHRPTRVDAPHGAIACDRLLDEAAVAEGGIGGQRGLHAFQEDVIIGRAAGTAADDGRALDHIGMQRRPVIGLHAAHRPAIDQGKLRDAEPLGEQPVLDRDGIVIGHDRERRGVFDGEDDRPLPNRFGMTMK